MSYKHTLARNRWALKKRKKERTLIYRRKEICVVSICISYATGSVIPPSVFVRWRWAGLLCASIQNNTEKRKELKLQPHKIEV